MKEIMPQGGRAAILWNPDSSNAELERKVVKDSAGAFQLAFTLHEARTLKDLENTLDAIPLSRPDMLIVLNDPFMFTHRKRMMSRSLLNIEKRTLPRLTLRGVGLASKDAVG